MKVEVLVHISHVNQYLLAFIETKHDTMYFNLATPLLNLELYIVSEYRHYAKKSTRPGKKAQKALQPIKQKQATEKKHSLRSLCNTGNTFGCFHFNITVCGCFLAFNISSVCLLCLEMLCNCSHFDFSPCFDDTCTIFMLCLFLICV